MEKKLKFSTTLLFSVGAVGKNMMYTVVSVYYMFYLTAVQGLSGTVVGAAFALARLWDAVNDPMMGTIVDNTRSRFGKFRPWIMTGTLINSAVLILMYLDFSSASTLLKYSLYLTLYILWGMSYTLMDVPYWSMIPAIAGGDKDKASLSSVSMLAAGLGSAVVMVGMPGIVFKYFTENAADPRAYRIAALIVAAAFTALCVVTVLSVKETFTFNYKKVRFKDILGIIVKNDQLVAYVLTTAAYSVASSILLEISTYYFVYDLHDTALEVYGVFILVLSLSQAAAMALFPLLRKKFSVKTIYVFAIVSSVIGFALMFLVVSVFKITSIFVLGACGIVAISGFGLLQVGSVIMLTDVVDYGELIMKNRTESIVFSLQTFVAKIGASVAALIVGIGIDLAGIQGADLENNVFPPMQNPYGLTIIRAIMFLLPILLMSLSLFFYLVKYKLKGNYLTEIRSGLEAARAAEQAPKEE